jgi:hypothetical protein
MRVQDKHNPVALLQCRFFETLLSTYKIRSNCPVYQISATALLSSHIDGRAERLALAIAELCVDGDQQLRDVLVSDIRGKAEVDRATLASGDADVGVCSGYVFMPLRT